MLLAHIIGASAALLLPTNGSLPLPRYSHLFFTFNLTELLRGHGFPMRYCTTRLVRFGPLTGVHHLSC
jgi:hypothetical protein